MKSSSGVAEDYVSRNRPGGAKAGRGDSRGYNINPYPSGGKGDIEEEEEEDARRAWRGIPVSCPIFAIALDGALLALAPVSQGGPGGSIAARGGCLGEFRPRTGVTRPSRRGQTYTFLIFRFLASVNLLKIKKV
jgi:hypothetical protein